MKTKETRSRARLQATILTVGLWSTGGIIAGCETKVVGAKGIGASSTHPITEESDKSTWGDFLGTEGDASSR